MRILRWFGGSASASGLRVSTCRILHTQVGRNSHSTYAVVCARIPDVQMLEANNTLVYHSTVVGGLFKLSDWRSSSQGSDNRGTYCMDGVPI